MNVQSIKSEVYCRTCLDTTVELASIYDNNLVDILKECVSIQINTNDTYSKMICTFCRTSLYQFNDFKQKCHETEKILKCCKTNDTSIHSDLANHPPPEVKLLEEDRKLNLDFSKTEANSHENNAYSDVTIGPQFKSSDESDSDDFLETRRRRKLAKIRLKPSYPGGDNDGEFSCPKCHKRFRLKRYLSAHINRHNLRQLKSTNYRRKDKRAEDRATIKAETGVDVKPSADELGASSDTNQTFDCGKCSKKFTQLGYLRRHLVVKHKILKKRDLPRDNTEHQCSICPKTFATRKYLSKHMQTHKKSFGPIICPIETCREQFTRRHALEHHIKVTHAYYQPNISCDKCDRRFYLQRELVMHERREHMSGICIECGLHVTELGVHKRQAHAQLKPYSCDDCGRKFKLERYLETHKRIHLTGQGDIRVICNHCGVKVHDIETHIIKKHPTNENQSKPKLTCRYCKMQFDKLSDLFEHSKRIHEKERESRKGTYPCKLCDKKYITIKGLRVHVKYIHSDFEPVVCKICSHESRTEARHQAHMRVHTDERPFQCEFCSRKFKSTNTLRDHRRIHTGERPYVCPTCCKGFIQRTAWKSHLRLHSK